MPIPTSSMYQNRNARRQRVRQLWTTFEQWVQKPRQEMVRTRDDALREAERKWRMAAQPLSTTTNTANRTTARLTHKEHEASKEKLRRSIERKHYLLMREEWEKRLHSAGLQVEDWDDMTAQDQLAVIRALGDFSIDDDDEANGDAEEEQDEDEEDEPFAQPAINFVPTGVAAQPLSQSVSHQSQSSHSSLSSNQSSHAPPSLASSRSYNTSSASYAFVDPKQFTDDEHDEPSLHYSGYNHSGYMPGSEDEGIGISIPTYKSWARDRQQQPSEYTTTWSSSNQSSLSSSPAAEPPLSRHTHQASSSFSSSHFPRVPSSLSTSINPKPTTTTTSTTTTSSSAAAAAAAASQNTKSRINTTYIGPHLTTPDSSSEAEADADLEEISEADQAEAFETFKMETRIQKIREFHEEAAQLDIELATTIWNNRRAAGLPASISSMSLSGFGSANGHGRAVYDKASEGYMISEHEAKMGELRERKEKERRAVVAAERKRRRDEIKKRQTGGHTTTTSTTKAHKNGFTSSSSASLSSANKTPAISTGAKPKMFMTPPATGMATGTGIEEWQTVLDGAPSLDMEAAWQISQLLQDGSDPRHHQEHHDQQDWGTPQHLGASDLSRANGARKRNDSISILDDSRFGTISAKSLGQRRGTISVATAGGGGTFGNASVNASSALRTQQTQRPPSPEESQSLTDRFARVIFDGGSNGREEEEEAEEEWDGWGPKPTSNLNGASKANTAASASSAWGVKKTSVAGSSSPTPSSAWGAGVKRTFGFGGSNTTTTGNSNGGENGNKWEEGWGGEEQQEEGEGEEEEVSRLSPFGSTGTPQKKPSLLSGMMMRGKNVVAGAVNAAKGPMNMSPVTPTTPTATTASGLAKKSGIANPPVGVSSVSASTTTTQTSAAKKGSKKQRQSVTKKGTLPSFMKEDETEENEAPELQQPLMTPTTPKPAASSTKFSSAFGSANAGNHSASGFGFGSSPTSRNPTSGAGGLWDDMVSTTPKPGSSLNAFGSKNNANAVGGGVGNGVRRPSGLHREVWSSEGGGGEGEQEEEGDGAEGQGGEGEWMPGSLNVRNGLGASSGKVGLGAATAMSATKKTTGARGWGSFASHSTTAPTPPTKATIGAPRKSSLLAGKRTVMVEEIPDEADGPWNRSPSDVLASDSRVILEPKPSKPSKMYEGIYSFGAASTSPENVRASGPGTGGLGVDGKPGVGASLGGQEDIYGEEWFRKAAMQLKRGTEEGERVFGSSAAPGPRGAGSKAGATTSNGINIPGRGTSNPNDAQNAGFKSNNPWGAAPSSLSSSPNVAGSMPMSGSFKDPSPLANGLPSKMSTNGSKSSLNQAWAAGLSSSPKVGVGIGKNAAAKTKATTETSTRFGMNTTFGWGAAPASSSFTVGAGDELEYDDGGWGEEGEQERQEREEILNSKKKLQELFGDSTGPSSGTGTKAGVGTDASQARSLKVQKENEKREQGREAKEVAEKQRVAREKEAKEKEAKEETKVADTATTKTNGAKAAGGVGGGKRGKGRKK